MGARRKANGEGKGGSRRKGKSRGTGRRAGGSTCCPHFVSFRTGAAYAAPFLFISNGGSTRCPRFFSFRTGAALAAPVSLRFERGGVCCPVSFHFERGQRMLPPFLFVNSGTYPPPSFLGGGFLPRRQRRQQGSVPSTRRPVRSRLSPPLLGGFPAATTTTTRRCATYTPPSFPFFSPPASTKTMGWRDIHTPPLVSSSAVNDDNWAACNLHAASFEFVYPPSDRGSGGYLILSPSLCTN